MANPEYKIIRAQYKGYCSACGNAIAPGEKIQHAKGRPTLHAECQTPEIPADAIHLSGGSGYGCKGWTPGAVIPSAGRGSTRDRRCREFGARFEAEIEAWDAANPEPQNTLWEGAPKAVDNGPAPANKYVVGDYPSLTAEFQAWYDEGLGAQNQWKIDTDFEGRAAQAGRDRKEHDQARTAAKKDLSERLESEFPSADAPEFLYVLTASQQYIREDGLSFWVGADSGYQYEATCRPATDEESAPLREAIERKHAASKAADDLKAIRKQIIDQGEWPEPTDGKLSPKGERINYGSGQNIYGGGAWFVIGPEWVWYVINNGADGDDWSSNNVRTGGAGAIGRRIPATTELTEKIKSLAVAAGFTENK